MATGILSFLLLLYCVLNSTKADISSSPHFEKRIENANQTSINFLPGPSPMVSDKLNTMRKAANYALEKSTLKSGQLIKHVDEKTVNFHALKKEHLPQKSDQLILDNRDTKFVLGISSIKISSESKNSSLAVDQMTKFFPPEQPWQKSDLLTTAANYLQPQISEKLISAANEMENTYAEESKQESDQLIKNANSRNKRRTRIFPYADYSQNSGMLNATKIPPKKSPQKPKHLITDINQAYKFAEMFDTTYTHFLQKAKVADWNYNVDMTDENKEQKEKLAQESSMFLATHKEKAKMFAWKEFKEKDPVLYRWFKLIIQPATREEGLKSVKCKAVTQEVPAGDMITIHSTAKICPYKSDGPCNLERADAERILEKSKDFDELAYVWTAYRNATGRKIRPFFVRDIESMNSAARSNGFADMGHQYRSEYESETFLEDVARYMEEIRPLYEHLHAFVRRRIMKHYTMIKEDGPIPVNVVGDMSGQKWEALFEMVNPFKVEAPNVTASMLKKKMKPIDMFKIAEDFYTSLGMKKMTKKFWKNSVIEKKPTVKMVCHASAEDMSTGDDFRIKMCTEVSNRYLNTVSHEMGHIQYDMNYAPLTQTFRLSANPGFTEAVGDAVVLSSSTPTYLKQIGLLEEYRGDEKEKELAYLLKMALTYVTSIPTSFIIDLWRYGVYKRDIKPNELNRKWWEMRLKYQGVCPPGERTEEDFDIGQKFHIPFHVEYMRYFIANIFQFQLYEALCEEAEFEGPLYKCNLYKNKKAGALFSKFLSYGRMKPWPELIEMLTNGATSNVETGPLLQYFEPLFKWLKKENEGHYIGWKSDNPMKCP